MANESSTSGEGLTQADFQPLEVGILAVVLTGSGGANRVRKKPKVGAGVKGKIPEHAVLAVLPKPKGWKKAYPYDDGVHVWWYVRGRTNRQRSSGRFEVIQGWTAASENGESYLGGIGTEKGCLDTMGTQFDTHLGQGLEAYVLASDGLNVRKEAGQDGKKKGALRTGTVVTVIGDPVCDSKTVWWQVEPLKSKGPSGWVSEGGFDVERDFLEWYLAPLTLM